MLPKLPNNRQYIRSCKMAETARAIVLAINNYDSTIDAKAGGGEAGERYYVHVAINRAVDIDPYAIAYGVAHCMRDL